MTIESLENELKNGKLGSLYLLYGEETYLLETIVKKIKKLFGEIIVGINYIQIDDTNVNTLINNINMPAFGYEKKLIIVKNSGLFKKNVGATFGRPKKNKYDPNIEEELSEYIKNNINEIKKTTVLIFIDVGAESISARIPI